MAVSAIAGAQARKELIAALLLKTPAAMLPERRMGLKLARLGRCWLDRHAVCLKNALHKVQHDHTQRTL